MAADGYLESCLTGRCEMICFCGPSGKFPARPTLMLRCFQCVGVFCFFFFLLACVHALLQKERALAPESALWGDHSCTLPAANWSLSSCPIHLHFLPITEHYLCSQLGMGLNPFWLSWCYSLQIYKWRKGKRGSGGRGKTGWSKSQSKNKLWNFPSSLIGTKQSINNDITRIRESRGRWVGRGVGGEMEEINYWRYNSSPCLQTLQPHWLGRSCCTHHYWLVKTIFSHHRCFYVLCTLVAIRLYGALIIQRVFIWFKTVLFTVLTIRAEHTAHPEGTSRCRNLG